MYYIFSVPKCHPKGMASCETVLCQICLDPIKEKPCTLSALRYRIHSHPDLYKNIIATDCIIKENQQ